MGVASLFKFRFPFQTPSRRRALIGLDIDAAAVRMVQLSRGSRGAVTLEHAACEVLPAGAIAGRQIADPDSIVAALRRLWQRSGASCTRVAIALPASAIITHRLSVPAGLDEEHLEIQVHNAARRYLPFAPEEICLDFDVLGPSGATPAMSTNLLDIQLSAARRSEVQQRTALLAGAGLEALIVDCDRYAAVHALARLQLPAGDIVLLQPGAHASQFTLLRAGSILLERELPAAGEHPRQHAADAGVADDYALLSRGLLQAMQATQTSPAADTTVDPARRARILLAGDVAQWPGLAEELTSATGMPTSAIDVFAGMQVRPGLHDIAQTSSAWAVACGLALRDHDGAAT